MEEAAQVCSSDSAWALWRPPPPGPTLSPAAPPAPLSWPGALSLAFKLVGSRPAVGEAAATDVKGRSRAGVRTKDRSSSSELAVQTAKHGGLLQGRDCCLQGSWHFLRLSKGGTAGFLPLTVGPALSPAS